MCRILSLVPPWVRVYRIQRDIPMPLVTSGVEKGNLRQLALARMAALGLRCRCAKGGLVFGKFCSLIQAALVFPHLAAWWLWLCDLDV